MGHKSIFLCQSTCETDLGEPKVTGSPNFGSQMFY